MKRLVNVSVNPFGRFGAPEMEPGPCGAVSVDDELMRVSLLSWDCELSEVEALSDCALTKLGRPVCVAAIAIAAFRRKRRRSKVFTGGPPVRAAFRSLREPR